jgi:integrin beta 2
MFFTKWGVSSPMLERTALDGSDRTVLVQQKIVYPYGVTVDYPTQHVYWVDTYLDFVERIDYDGSNRRTIRKGFPVSLKEYFHRCKFLVSISGLKKALTHQCP